MEETFGGGSEKDSGMSSCGKAGTEDIPLGSAKTSEQNRTEQNRTREEKAVADPMMAVGVETCFQMRERSEGQPCEENLLSDHQWRGPQARMYSSYFLSEFLGLLFCWESMSSFLFA